MLSLAESRSDRLALRAALEPASSAAARLRSIWRRKSPFLTLSPSRTARFTTWPCTSADISTLFSAWILPLAVTLETMSCVATRAVRTGVALFRVRQTAAPAPNTSMPATMIQMRRLRRVKARQATSRPDQRQPVSEGRILRGTAVHAAFLTDGGWALLLGCRSLELDKDGLGGRLPDVLRIVLLGSRRDGIAPLALALLRGAVGHGELEVRIRREDPRERRVLVHHRFLVRSIHDAEHADARVFVEQLVVLGIHLH